MSEPPKTMRLVYTDDYKNLREKNYRSILSTQATNPPSVDVDTSGVFLWTSLGLSALLCLLLYVFAKRK